MPQTIEDVLRRIIDIDDDAQINKLKETFGIPGSNVVIQMLTLDMLAIISILVHKGVLTYEEVYEARDIIINLLAEGDEEDDN